MNVKFKNFIEIPVLSRSDQKEDPVVYIEVPCMLNITSIYCVMPCWEKQFEGKTLVRSGGLQYITPLPYDEVKKRIQQTMIMEEDKESWEPE